MIFLFHMKRARHLCLTPHPRAYHFFILSCSASTAFTFPRSRASISACFSFKRAITDLPDQFLIKVMLRLRNDLGPVPVPILSRRMLGSGMRAFTHKHAHTAGI